MQTEVVCMIPGCNVKVFPVSFVLTECVEVFYHQIKGQVLLKKRFRSNRVKLPCENLISATQGCITVALTICTLSGSTVRHTVSLSREGNRFFFSFVSFFLFFETLSLSWF